MSFKARCADQWRDMPREELQERIVDVRQQRSAPVLTMLQAWLEGENFKLLPRCSAPRSDDRQEELALLRQQTRLPRLGLAPSRDDLRRLLPDRWTKP